MAAKQKKKKLTVAGQIGGLQTSFDRHIEIETPQWKGIKSTIDEMSVKLDRILNVKINGAQGFEDVLTYMWEATAGARWRIRAKRAVAKWSAAHPTLKSAIVWLLKKAVWLLLIIAAATLMQYLGLGEYVGHLFKFQQ